MLFARSSWLRWYGSACLIFGVLVFVAHEQGLWRDIKLSWPGSSSLSALQNGVETEENTILSGIQTGKGSKMIVIGKIKKDDTTWVQRDLPE